MNNTFKKAELDKYEVEIESAIKGGAYQDDPNKQSEALLKRLKSATHNTLAKNATVNFRVNRFALARFKAKANEQGMPYQTLLASIMHQYVTRDGTSLT